MKTPLSSCCSAPAELQKGAITASNMSVYLCSVCLNPCSLAPDKVERVEIPEQVEVFEIWSPVDEGGEVYNATTGKSMKLAVLIVNGVVVKLEKDWMLEKRYITKEQSDNLIKNL